MPVALPRLLTAAAAVPALVVGLAACGAGSGAEDSAADGGLSPEEVVLASYTGLESESYRMDTVVTINELAFLDMTNTVEGESSHSSQDLNMGVLMEAMGEDISEMPEMAEFMEAMFSDTHTETIIVDGVAYLQISGGMLDMSEQYGEDAWFSVDLAEHADLDEIYEQFGGFDLASQTERLLTEINDVEETGDGVYTGTLSPESEIMNSLPGTADATGGASGREALEAAEVVITVDEQGLLKTMEMTVPAVDGMTVHMVSEVVEIGGEYGIAAPDSDNIHPFEDFAGATP